MLLSMRCSVTTYYMAVISLRGVILCYWEIINFRIMGQWWSQMNTNTHNEYALCNSSLRNVVLIT